MGDVPLSLLRPALELAWVVAKAGEAAAPPVPAPGPIRRLLRFARLGDRALATIRTCVESDDAFRERVADEADEAALGRASWLWLRRPEGWAAELDEFAQQTHDAATAETEAATERRASRKLAAAEEARERAEAKVSELREALAKRRRDANEQRRARLEAERALAELHHAVEASEAAARDAKTRAAAAEAGLAALREELAARPANVPAVEPEVPEPEAPAVTPVAPVGEAAVEGIHAASAAAQQLADALRDIALALATETEADPVSAPAPDVTPGSAPRPRPRVRRQPVRLPGGVFDDSIEAADHLMRVPRMMLFVDGYNVTIPNWGEKGIADQRHRLVNALAELAMRTAVRVTVVFDSHPEEQFPPVPGRARSAIRMWFSPTGVDADEVIIDAVRELPPSQPVTVATDDRRIRDAVAARGANVISNLQLLGVLGRNPGPGPERPAGGAGKSGTAGR